MFEKQKDKFYTYLMSESHEDCHDCYLPVGKHEAGRPVGGFLKF